MGYIIGAICIFLAIVIGKSENKWYNPVTIFYIVWGLILIMYELRLYGLFEVSYLTYSVISLGLLFFFIGYLVNNREHRIIRITSMSKIRNIHMPTHEEINYKIARIAACIVLIYFILEGIETLKLIKLGYSLFDIRTALQGYTKYDFTEQLTGLRSQLGIFYTVILSMYNSLLVLICIDFFAGKRDKWLIGMTVACLLVKSMKEGSRVTLFSFIIYFIFAMIIYRKSIKISRKIKKIITISVLFLIIAMVSISIIRLKKMQKTLFEEIYLYFTCCIPLLDYWINTLNNNLIKYTHGATSLYGIVQIPVLIIQVLYGHSIEWYRAGAQAIADTETFITVRDASYSYRSNAYTTLFYYLYKDAGLLGVAVGSTIFSTVCTSVYKRVIFGLNKSIKSERVVYIYLLLIQAMILSFVRSYFAVASFSFAFGFAFLFISKKH